MEFSMRIMKTMLRNQEIWKFGMKFQYLINQVQ